jgi:dTDP-4-amino-4,6-dideoxygalactose transaminase
MIPMVDLHQQYRRIEPEINAAVKAVLTSSNFILGPVVEDFEHRLAEYCECDYAVGVASGTDALLLAMLAVGIGEGDEVITTPFTFVATASAISRTGATPVFLDIDSRTFNIDVSQIESAITERTKAVVPVHLYGQPAYMDEILAIARKYDLYVMEDAAQAIGARYKGRRVGALAHAGAISFYPTKNLGAYGDGGIVVTNCAIVADRVDVLRRHGSQVKYYHECVGFNSRLDAIQAAILEVKLQYLDTWQEQRREAAYRYNALFEGTEIAVPHELPYVYHVYHQYTIKVPERRDALRAYLLNKGIQTMVYYPLGLHRQALYESLGYSDGQLPVTESVCKHVISLPCFPEITTQQQEIVVNAIRKFFNGE